MYDGNLRLYRPGSCQAKNTMAVEAVFYLSQTSYAKVLAGAGVLPLRPSPLNIQSL
jgi:hypothetical protein